MQINKGLFVHGIHCAYYGLSKFETFNDAIKHVIMLGGDTDTNGSIAGAMIGAYYGYNKMICDLEVKNNLDIILNHDSSTGSYSIAPKYRPNVLINLINKI